MVLSVINFRGSKAKLCKAMSLSPNAYDGQIWAKADACNAARVTHVWKEPMTWATVSASRDLHL